MYTLTLKPCSTVYSSPDNQISIIRHVKTSLRQTDASQDRTDEWNRPGGQEKKPTAGIADLDTSLTNVHRDDFTHFDTTNRAETTKMRDQCLQEGATRRGRLTKTEDAATTEKDENQPTS